MNRERVASAMRDAGLDALLATTYENVHYLGGPLSASLKLFPRDAQVYALVKSDRLGEPCLVAGIGDMDTLAAMDVPMTTVSYGTFFRQVDRSAILSEVERRVVEWGIERPPLGSPAEALIAAIRENDLERCRIGYDQLAPAALDQVVEAFGSALLVPAGALLKEARLHKTDAEVELLRRSAHITEDAIQAAVAITREGTTEIEMAIAFNRHLVEQGSDPVVAFIRFGANGGVSQVPASNTPLKHRDLIWFDVCGAYRGYQSDLARTFALGDPGSRARGYYSALLAAEEAAIEAARPGARAVEVFDACVATARANGIPHYRRHHVGHGIGLEVYEAPLLAPGQELALFDGMVLNVEAPYYEVGFGALHVEDPIRVGRDGNDLLTRTSRELVVL
jgi:Xaa-Pro aminopeptidase